VTDYQLVAKKLVLIETSVGELRTLVHLEAIPDDLRELRLDHLDDLLQFVSAVRAKL
jgi:hypothetical protein